jgi:hypothetical protein
VRSPFPGSPLNDPNLIFNDPNFPYDYDGDSGGVSPISPWCLNSNILDGYVPSSLSAAFECPNDPYMGMPGFMRPFLPVETRPPENQPPPLYTPSGYPGPPNVYKGIKFGVPDGGTGNFGADPGIPRGDYFSPGRYWRDVRGGCNCVFGMSFRW